MSKTNFLSPRAIRSIVLGASGLTARTPYFSLISCAVSKMLGQGWEKSICVYAPAYGFLMPAAASMLSAGAWVGSGHTIGRPSHRATRKNLFLIVGAP